MNKVLATLVVISASTSLSAAVIDHGAYNTDTVTGYDWLDLSLTDGMSHSQATSAYAEQGYIVASRSHVVALLENYGISMTSHSTPGIVPFNAAEAAVNQFVQHFGDTYGSQNPTSAGSFLDASSENGAGSYVCMGWQSCVQGGSFVNDIDISGGNYGSGVFMVRGVAEVPIPGAAWLFGSALIGLIRCRFGR